MITPSLHHEIWDRLVYFRMEALNGDLEEEWLDPETDMIVRDKLPAHLWGQYDQIKENALTAADSIMGLIRSRLQ